MKEKQERLTVLRIGTGCLLRNDDGAEYKIVNINAFLNSLDDQTAAQTQLGVASLGEIYDAVTSILSKVERRQLELDEVLVGPAEDDTDSEPETMNAETAAQMVMRKYHFATVVDKRDVCTVYYYDSGVYLDGGVAKIKAWVEANVRQEPTVKFVKGKIVGLNESASVTTHFVSEVLGHVQRKTFRSRGEFDSNPNILNLKNGLLNVETGEFDEHSPDYLSSSQLPVEYYKRTGYASIEKFLSEVAYPEDVPAIQEFVGYCLWRGYPENKALFLIGDGSNGKSVFLGLVKALLGAGNVACFSLQELETNGFSKAYLDSKLANIFPDLPDTALRQAGVFKALTGNDSITTAHKFGSPFTFVNIAKMIFSANKIPEVYEDTMAFFRRWILVTFPNTFDAEKADRNLLAKLTTPESLSGFLNWALVGLNRLKSNGWKFSNSKSVEIVREEYIRKSSPIQAFFKDCVENHPDGVVTKVALYQAFADYCRSKHLPVSGQESFFMKMNRFAEYRFPTERREMDGSRKPCFIGLRVVNPVNPVKGLSYSNQSSGVNVEERIGNRVAESDRSAKIDSFAAGNCAVCMHSGAQPIVRSTGLVYLHEECQKEWEGQL